LRPLCGCAPSIRRPLLHQHLAKADGGR